MTVSTSLPAAPANAPTQGWRDAVVYQVFVRSFRDGNGDGLGDLTGLREGLEHIAALGCDAIWLSPCYASPQHDHGYDIADYRRIDPSYGTLADFDAMVKRAHQLGLRVLMDMVANHCSIEHAWFRAALVASPGSPERGRFIFRDGRGPRSDQPPNNWESVFGGPAWTRVTEPDGSAGQWYLHAFDASQPDFNWRNPEVAEEFLRVLRFWFDRGVDGFRIDVAHGNVKAVDLPDHLDGGHNYAMWDQPEVHDIYRSWRALGDSYPEAKYFVGEVWLPSQDMLASYLRPDELHQAFDFGLLVQPWDAARMRSAIEMGLRAGGPDASVGPVEPRRAPDGDQIRPGPMPGHAATHGHDGRSPASRTRRPGTRRAACPRGRRPAAGSAGLGLPLPGRGARLAGGVRPAKWLQARPHLAPLRRT